QPDGGPPGHVREAAGPRPAHPHGDAGRGPAGGRGAARGVRRAREDGDRDGQARAGRGAGACAAARSGRRDRTRGRRSGGGVKVVGMLSGTWLDGNDAARVELESGDDGEIRWGLRSFVTLPYSPAQREEIHTAIVNGGAAELCVLHARLGEWFAGAALDACRAAGVAPAEVEVIGSHGQTVWHVRPAEGQRGATLQLGCAATIAERTGIAVVSDFRSRDMAAGGEGAPLVPWVDRLLFAAPDRRRALQNIGGMGNVTWLPPRGDDSPLLAFDTGPGVALIDAAVELATGGRETYDRGGEWAARGRVQESLLAELLAHPFFDRPPPKSTGREVFGRPLVEALVARSMPLDEQAW